jgi:hypothetical protein
VARHVVEKIAAAEPSRVLQFESSGDVRGEWDGTRAARGSVSDALAVLRRAGVGNALSLE